MPLINESHDSLPYIDAEPTARDRAAAHHLISTELPADYQSNVHPAIPALPESHFTPLMEQELGRQAAGLPLTGGIDLARYEAPEPPSGTSKTEQEASQALQEWREALQRAYTSSSHLSMRHTNLTLLEESGKNAWLISNSQLEDILRGVEKELAETKEAVETVHKERKMAQEAGQGELVGLEETWRHGVGSALDVEVGAESLRIQLLEKRRQLAQQSAR